MRARGIAEDHIIMMAYDDIANNTENPFPGKLFNAPDPDGPGKDVYAGCKMDYTGEDVSVDNWVSVLTGAGSGKVLKSTAEDNVFINFIDHGAPGLISFPSTVMHKDQLQETLATMHSKKMFKKLVFYLETCESGSMFEDLSVPGVYAVSAANAIESSWGTYCGSEGEDVVDGKALNTCLGDLFSVNWMQNIDTSNILSETLEAQFKTVQNLTNKSHVMQFGDTDFTSDPVSAFFGNHTAGLQLSRAPKPRNSVDSRGATLQRFYREYAQTDSSATRMAVTKQLQELLARQYAADAAYVRLGELAYPGDAQAQHASRHLMHKPKHMECELAGHRAMFEGCAGSKAGQFNANSGEALRNHQVVVNICADIAEKGLNLDIGAAAMEACGKDASIVV